MSPFPLCDEIFLLAWFLYRFCAGNHNCYESISLIIPRRHHFTLILASLWLLQPFYPISCNGPWALGVVVVMDAQLVADPFTDTFPLYWVSAVHCRDILWRVLRATLIYGYRDINLEGSLVLGLFSKIIVVCPSMGPMSFPDNGFLDRFTEPGMYSLLWWVGLKLVTYIAFMPLLYLWCILLHQIGHTVCDPLLSPNSQYNES